ncbi:MAG: PEGA domain-containing protein [Planctomycetes bacterium]|nr:PEGA domain-containing protein [Planctomycetota bacterium]
MKHAALALLPLLLLVQVGCVNRRLTIRSNPPGAFVYVDNQPIGYTPVSTYFNYYGTREIRLEKDGFETLKVKQRFAPPWYQYPPFDLISENFWPRETRDERVLEFQLKGRDMLAGRTLKDRADAMRANTRQGVSTPIFNPAAQPLPPPAGR